MLVWISAFIYQAGLIEIVLKSAQHDPFLGPHVQLPEDQQELENNDTNGTPSPSQNDQNGDVNSNTKEGSKDETETLLISKFRDLTFLQGSSKNMSAMIHSKTSQNTG